MKNLFEGKKDLNKYVTSVSVYGAEFHIYYWGGWERYFGTKEHMHSFFEMTYVLDGTGEYHEGNVSYSLTPYSLILSRPNYEHQLFSEQGMKTLYFAFDLKENESDDEWKHYIQYLKQEINPVFTSRTESIYSNLWKALYQSAIEMEYTCKKKMLKQLAPQLLITTFDCFYPLPKQEPSVKNKPFDEHNELIYRVNLYIKDNLHKNIKISDVADDLYVSKRHLSRLMREETGKTFTEILQDERLSLATEYLRKTNKSVKNISLECGFLDVSYFTKLFTRTMRYPPTIYRRMYQGTIESEFKDR